MGIKRAFASLVERATGSHIYGILPRGVDVFSDVRVRLPRHRMDVLLDVGANVGQSAEAYAKRFPEAKILCFEPVAESFRILEAATRRFSHVRCLRVALGARKGKARMVSEGSSTMNRIVDGGPALSGARPLPIEEVDVTTLDDVCDAERVPRVSYLKIDAEGSELDILRGAARLLSEQRVDLVELESGMNPDNTRHVPLTALKGVMEAHRYYVFGIYEQVPEWPTGEPHLRRVNAVFVSAKMIDAHRRPPSAAAFAG